jgi:DnaD/phage-associated family protein
MQGFPGFPAGDLPGVALPAFFFSDLLPLIDDLAELKVTLHALWLLDSKPGTLRFVQASEFLADERLRAGLAEHAIADGLERAVARGTLLPVTVERYGQALTWYFLNDEPGRDAIDRIRRGQVPEFDDPLADNTGLRAARPNIFVLYEQNIGLLQPIIADELRDAELRYPADWIEDAFRIAVEQNKRAWRYIRAILERWATEGRDAADAAPRSPRTRRSKSKRVDPYAW